MGATQRELLEERWNGLLRDVERVRRTDGTVELAAANSKRFCRIDRTLEELAVNLVDELMNDRELGVAGYGARGHLGRRQGAPDRLG